MKISKSASIYLSLCQLLVLFMISACGKSTNSDQAKKDSGVRKPSSPQLWSFIQKQKLDCEDSFLCDESVAKLVVIDSQTIRYCTGVLVGNDTILTSASCLTRALKVPGIDCSENVFAIFPKTNNKAQQIFRCDQVIQADINEEAEDFDKALWRSDLAYLKFKQSPNRKVLEISRDGLKDNEHYTVWKTDYVSDTDATLVSSTCSPVYGSYMNPFALNEYAPFIPLKHCQFMDGNTGGVVLNDKGEVAGIISRELDESVKKYVLGSGLLREELKPMVHAVNMACSKYPKKGGGDILGPRQHMLSDCSMPTDQARLDKLRAQLLKGQAVHAANMRKIEEDLEKFNSKYFHYKFAFKANSLGDSYEMHLAGPRCFYDIKKWINEFKKWGRYSTYAKKTVQAPYIRVKAALSGELRPISIIEKSGDKTYTVEFNPRNAWNAKKTDVKVTGSLFGVNREASFSNITSNCNPLSSSF